MPPKVLDNYRNAKIYLRDEKTGEMIEFNSLDESSLEVKFEPHITFKTKLRKPSKWNRWRLKRARKRYHKLIKKVWGFDE